MSAGVNDNTSKTDFPVSGIVAIARNEVIGRDNALPWRMRDDLKWFKEITLRKPVIMGRTTFESLKAPLPDRHNIVLSRQELNLPDGVSLAHTVAHAIAIAVNSARELGAEEICVIGGSQIYQAMMPYLSRLYITHIDADIEGDTYLSLPDKADWTIETLRLIQADDRNDYGAVIEKWDRES